MAELPITMDDSIPQQAGPGAGADELHAAIMNLPCNVPKGYAPGKADEVVYRIGHRDARHAAAELVLSHLAAPLAVEDSRERCASSDAKDAARYHFIRAAALDQNDDKLDLLNSINETPDGNDDFDATVDAAMAAASSGDTKEKMNG